MLKNTVVKLKSFLHNREIYDLRITIKLQSKQRITIKLKSKQEYTRMCCKGKYVIQKYLIIFRHLVISYTLSRWLFNPTYKHI